MTNIVDRDISERFDIDDIRKIRDNNASRHVNMSASEIVEEIKNSTDELINQYGFRRPVSCSQVRGM